MVGGTACVRRKPAIYWPAFRNKDGLIERPIVVGESCFRVCPSGAERDGFEIAAAHRARQCRACPAARSGDRRRSCRQITVAEAEGDSLVLSSELEVGGRAVELSASATRDRSTRLISNLELAADASETEDAGGDAAGSQLGSG